MLDDRVPGSSPAPLVVVLHGWYGSPEQVAESSGMGAVGAVEGFVVAYGRGERSSWNAGRCCGASAAAGVDDVAYLGSLVGDVAARRPLDLSRVYVAGFSNGGMMALRAACSLPEVFAAAATVAGTLVSSCENPVAVVHVHGTGDGTVPFEGGFSEFTKVTFPAVRAEEDLLPAGSTWSLLAFDGAHEWPTEASAGLAATDLVWDFFSRHQLGPDR